MIYKKMNLKKYFYNFHTQEQNRNGVKADKYKQMDNEIDCFYIIFVIT